MINLSQKLAINGISLELSGCISSEAFQAEFAGESLGREFVRTQAAMRDFDPGRLLTALQPALVEGLQALQVSLAEQASELLRAEMGNSPTPGVIQMRDG
ncbi:MAG: hypothetical protein JKY26_17540 [Pseudomonas sp.]|nr:hypothetical protein [Pseudomonas sp.]